MIDQMTVDAAVADARLAAMEFDDAQAWLRTRQTLMEPLAVEVWVTDPAYSHVLLVRHRVRGWVPPSGKVEPGETPRAAAARELVEEAGVEGELLPVPAAVAVRSFRADWAPTLSLSYVAVIGRDVPLSGENGQPSKWVDLNETWESVFPEDRDRIREYVRRLATEHAVGAHESVASARSEDRVDHVQDVAGQRHQLELVKESDPHRLQARLRRELFLVELPCSVGRGAVREL